MSREMPVPLVAVDVGNTRIKLGWFEPSPSADLAEPSDILELDARTPAFESLEPWLADRSHASWCVASVNHELARHIQTWIADERPDDPIRILRVADLGVAINLPKPERVGIDRVLGAVAANKLRAKGRRALVVDLGTAITVDSVSAGGAFLGGAILPGIGLSARALHEHTHLLPHLAMKRLDAPPNPLGKSTAEAIESGLYWGAVGAIRELVARMSDGADAVDVFLTGGAAASVADLVGPNTRYLPHLVLSGMAAVCGETPR